MDNTPLKEFQVKEQTSLIDALRVIDQAQKEIAFVVDQEERLLGTVTDGDIRRGLLRQLPLDAPISEVYCRSCTSVDTHTSPQEALDLMLSRKIKTVPVVDDKGCLAGFFNLHDLLRVETRPNWAVLMAGGKGTRLRPLTEGIPKPMLPIGDRPLIERIIMHLVTHGVRRIFISVGYLGQMIEDHFGSGERLGCEISYLRETTPLGTGGCLSLLPETPTHPLLVMNGDLLTNLHIGRLLDFHKQGGFVATMGMRDYEMQIPYGVVETAEHCVQRLVEKPSLSYHINAGVYVLEPSLVKKVPGDRLFPITELFNQSIEANERVGAYSIQESWVDIGLPEHYFAHHSNDTDS